MKKMLVAAAMFAAAITVNAASVAWEYNDGTSAAANGYNVYLVIGSTAITSMESADKFLADYSESILSQGKVSGFGFSPKTYKVSGSVNQDAKLPKGQDYYFVVIDSAKEFFYTTDVYAGTNIYDTDKQETKGATTTFGMANIAASKTAIGASDTPEPTSGLLLLLGVAGLALRRKQA